MFLGFSQRQWQQLSDETTLSVAKWYPEGRGLGEQPCSVSGQLHGAD